MKKILLCSLIGCVISLAGCSNLPLKTSIKENHFRIENLRKEHGNTIELAYLMCYRKKPVKWTEPKQYIAGKHELWVHAVSGIHTDHYKSLTTSVFPKQRRDAYVKFNVDLAPSVNYMLNANVEDDKVSVWIEDAKSGERVSSVQVAKLDQPHIFEETRVRDMCKSSTI